MNIQEYKERSELSREQGHLPEALVSIDQAIALAGAQAEYKELLECMAYRLEVWKFFYKKTKQEVFWELLKGDCMSGLQIADAYKVYGHPRAVMLLRRGTYEMFKESFSEAVVWFEKAYAELSGEAEVGTRAEFLGHLGEAEGLSGKRVGVTHLEQAVEQICRAVDMRPFHKLVIESGVRLRLARVFMRLDRPREALEQLQQARTLSVVLDKEYAMASRLEQCRQFAARYKFD